MTNQSTEGKTRQKIGEKRKISISTKNYHSKFTGVSFGLFQPLDEFYHIMVRVANINPFLLPGDFQRPLNDRDMMFLNQLEGLTHILTGEPQMRAIRRIDPNVSPPSRWINSRFSPLNCRKAYSSCSSVFTFHKGAATLRPGSRT